ILIPLGLILNELITNSMKYAFDESGGEVLITLKEKNNSYTLSVKDTGKGFPEEVLKDKKSNLGLILVRSLAEQIKGNLLLYNNNGAGITISFVLPEVRSGKE
ncbi:MAG: sensor histidine kinase, partial [Spirochaetales bacterium]|nr:sensor histidine kinase [Spirochaetales bacterium]